MESLMYEPTFNTAVDFTLRSEGRLSNNRNDAGGLTKFGVTHDTWDVYRALKKDPLLPKSVAAITVDHAIDVYYELFWKKPKINLLPAEVQVPAFDFQVNSGFHAIETLQRVLGVAADGDIGPATLAKLAPLQGTALRRLRNDYVTARGVYLMNLAQTNTNDVTFIEGWFRRVAKLYDFAY
jgi:lysozyme family protein